MNNIELDYLQKYISLEGESLTDKKINEIKNCIKCGKMPNPGGNYNFLMGNNLLNLKKDVTDKRDYLLEKTPLVAGQVIDWTKSMSPVKNQGRLGSCVGFAISAMKEWQEQKEHAEEVAEGKKNHRDQKYYDLSEQWVYYMCKKIDPWPGQEGTSIRVAMKVLQKIGVPTEKAWPYNDVVRGEPAVWANLVARWSQIGAYWRVRNLTELRAALVNGPVVIGIPCFEEIFSVGKNGFITYPKNPDRIYGGHAICAVGFDDGRKLVKFKNSWSKKWGKKGYGFLPYKYIQDFLWDAWAARDLNVTKKMLKGTRELI